MAEFGTVRRAGAGVRTAQIDEGLRAHMNKVYGLMAVAMVITGARRPGWSAPTSPRAVAGEPTAIIPAGVLQAMFTSPLKWVIMFAPLAVVFGLRRRRSTACRRRRRRASSGCSRR